MATQLLWLNDASVPVSAEDWGTINAGESNTLKLFLTNQGTSTASGVVVKKRRAAGSDGVDYVSIAQDDGGGNPGTFGTDDVFIGNVEPDALIPLWIKVALPNGVSPAGNQRIFDYVVDFQGT